MDLLLYLVKRNEMDICDIPIARVAELSEKNAGPHPLGCRQHCAFDHRHQRLC